MSDISRRSILRAVPGTITATVVPAVTFTAAADAAVVALAARVVTLAKANDDAYDDRSTREDAASDEYPQRPAILTRGYPDRRDGESVARLQDWADSLEPTDLVYPEVARRLTNMKAWKAECAVIDERHGIPAADARCDLLNEQLLDDLVPELTDMQPTTLAGLGSKADAVASLESWGAHEVIAALSASLIADVRRLAGGAHADAKLSESERAYPVWAARDRLDEIGHLVGMVQAVLGGIDDDEGVRGPILFACDLIYSRVREADAALKPMTIGAAASERPSGALARTTRALRGDD